MKKLPSRVSKRKSNETTRAATVRVLKLRGQCSVADLCKALNLTQTAVRRALSALQQGGLVEHQCDQQRRGRPVHSYKLTANSAECFPNGYAKLAQNLLDSVFQRGGHAAVMELLKTNNDRTIAALQPQFASKTLKARTEALASYFTDNGYMSDWLTLADGNLYLYNQHCAVYNLAVHYRQFCILEPRLIETLTGYKIFRQQYILKDQPVCGYVIDARRPLD